MKRLIIFLLSAIFIFNACDKVLDPMDDGAYTDSNINDYPSIIRGFVDKAFVQISNTYLTDEYVYLDCATDNGVLSTSTQSMEKFANGSLRQTDDPFAAFWNRDYTAISYVNRFLDKNVGLNTHYYLDAEMDVISRRNYQGDAYGLRAWFQYDLLLKFGGVAENGDTLGFPIIDRPIDQNEFDQHSFKRNKYDDCVAQILKDCDSALVYLPLANRDWLTTNTTIQGACRWQKLDQISVKCIKALTYLLWASDAFNPNNDITRWEKAAEYAAEAINFKINQDALHGFDPLKPREWTDPNCADMFWASRPLGVGNTMETAQYPNGFRGKAEYAPSQELVDAFPMNNGYPITDYRSGYDKSNPYANRDPRFYATIFYNGSKVLRDATEGVMYTFDTSVGGKDASGNQSCGLTNYYLKKFIHLGWNGSDTNIQTMPRCVFLITWTDMLLVYAEAANRAWGPKDNHLGLSAKDALAYLRKRSTIDLNEGLGIEEDPYLEECAGSTERFEELVRNERRIETCFEGKRFFDLIRWKTPLPERNATVHGVRIEGGKYSYPEIGVRNFYSNFFPIPYKEMIAAKSLVQNKGWENWK